MAQDGSGGVTHEGGSKGSNRITAVPDEPRPRLETLKALGDNTRYAIYLELARSPVPLATAQIAARLGLHANTVRPHLERMREVGLLELHVDARGGVGRPQHLYSLTEDAPSLGLEPSPFPMLARMLLRMATVGGLAGEDAVEAGREQGEEAAGRYGPALPCLNALEAELERLGFDPETVASLVDAGDEADPDGPTVTLAFAHCPFRTLAEENPELICSLHHGMVAGFVGKRGDADVVEFRTLVDRQPCQVDLAVAT